MPDTQSAWTRLRTMVSVGVTVVVAATFLTAISPVHAKDLLTPVVGSFSVGGDVTGGVDERTGTFDVELPLLNLPGLDGDAVTVGLSYAQERAEAHIDRFGLGVGWAWSGSFVDVNGGVRVFPASGGVFNADASKPSGLDGYVLGDIVFSQQSGTLPERPGIDAVNYMFSLTYLGGTTDYFNAEGDLLTRVDVFGSRTDWVWAAGSSHRLISVVDNGGSRADIVWGEAGIGIIAPKRGDGVISKTTLGITGERLISVTDPVQQQVAFRYGDTGLLERVTPDSGAVTEISYQNLPDTSVVVDRIRVADPETNEQLSVREWDVAADGRTAQGWPKYASQAALWASGDDEYRYQTQMSDGATRIVSEYNSQGLMVARHMVVSSTAGDEMLQEQKFVFPGTEDGGVADPQMLPKQYQKPISTQVVFRDPQGRTRQVSEQTTFDDAGRVTKQVSTDGQVTETVYDTEVPAEMVLPVGMVLEQTTTGPDGSVAKTVNTPTPDRKAIAVTETFVGTKEGTLTSQSRIETVVDSDGFVSEERVVATSDAGEGPNTVVTRFARTVDDNAGTVTLSQTSAAGSSAESTASMVMDKATGLTMTTIDPTGRAATTTYDAAGRILTETDSTGLVTVTEYGDKVTRVTDPLGVTSSEYVDVLGQVVTVTDNITITGNNDLVPVAGIERVVERRTYEQNSSKVRVTDPWGQETVSVSDVFGRVIEITTPNGIRQITEYDDVTNTVRTGLVAGTGGLENAAQVSTSVMDDTDRVVKETSIRADGIPVPESTTSYDGLGRVTEQLSADVSTNVVRNPNGTSKTTTLSPTKPQVFAGQPVTAERDHNVLGVPTKKTLTQPDGQTREGVSRMLDAAGQTISETDQAGQTTSYEYTVDGLVKQVRNGATGVVTHNTYDPMTRALTVTETVTSEGAISRTGFEYDRITGDTLEIYDLADPDGTRISYVYDVFGNVTQISYPDEKIIRHNFNEFGRETNSTDIAGNVTEYEYDRLGLLTRATQKSPDNTFLATVEYEYDDFGRMVKLSRGNGITTEYTFTSADQIKTETTTHADTIIVDASYEYDTHGNLTRRVDTRQDSITKPEAAARMVTETSTYTYDTYNRLTASNVYDGVEPVGEPRLHTEYEINVSGDVTKEITITRAAAPAEVSDTTLGIVTVREFEYNPLGHVTAVTTNGVRAQQEYDAAGNVTRSLHDTAYTYNVFNQSETETRPDGSTVQSSYWITGQHKTNTTTPVQGENATSDLETNTVEMYWDGSTLINETHATATLESTPDTVSYLIGATRHARTVSPTSQKGASATNYYVTDRHGNTNALTGKSGEITATYTYTDYGQISTRIDNTNTGPEHRNPFLYSGEYTTETGTQYLGARTYDPTVMRFTTQDTAALHNLYAYGNSNPITLIDPTGQTPDWDVVTSGVLTGVGVVLAVIGLAFSIWTVGASLGLINSGILILGAADVALVGTQVANEYFVDFMETEESELLSWAGLAFGGLGMATGLFRKAGKAIAKASTLPPAVNQAKNVTVPKNFDEAAQTYANQPSRMQAWRLMFTKNGERKTYYHGTTVAGAETIPKTGFDPAFRNYQVYGDGAYLSKTKGTAEYFAGLNSNPDGKLRVLHVQPDFSRATAMKFVDTGDGFRIKNPFYSKNQPGGTRFLNPDVKYKSREAASVSAGMTASYFSANPYMAKTNLRYLLVHQENAKTGFLPVNGINLELITPELTDAL